MATETGCRETAFSRERSSSDGGLAGDAAVVGDELEGMRWVAAYAALVAVARVAVDELLLRQGDQFPPCDLPRPLHCRRSREGPAGACITHPHQMTPRTLRCSRIW
ncbi:unnamed protein product [Spirodela intermedia]|uniref:Uncharacterized protein n=2 Tax=Spirodela intermedia TaxID=51605 RepID=A0A7I8LI79_SPIIN|nr:unnamed protein product [Spirodela intermedia]CAA6672525.1 unnamed protein product [Spirodela intermedia]CAA7409749.1 unnamed protein product [Spirodela intermedia]